jgi:hypothetical protein
MLAGMFATVLFAVFLVVVSAVPLRCCATEI